MDLEYEINYIYNLDSDWCRLWSLITQVLISDVILKYLSIEIWLTTISHWMVCLLLILCDHELNIIINIVYLPCGVGIEYLHYLYSRTSHDVTKGLFTE